jgi:hypothetical protein
MSQMPARNPVMPHLDPERLAALDTDAPTVEERAHLAGCAVCQQERLAFGRLAALALAESASTPVANGPPLTDWDRLSTQLRAEGLMRQPGAGLGASRGVHLAPDVGGPRSAAFAAWTRSAAAILLLATGVAAGRVSVGPSAPSAGDGTAVGTLASSTSATTFGSVSEASQALERAQQDYQAASLWLAANDTTVNAQEVYRARLAALDQMMSASRAGLYEAPQDPVLNQYYLAAYTAREATLRQLGASLSVDRVMERY